MWRCIYFQALCRLCWRLENNKQLSNTTVSMTFFPQRQASAGCCALLCEEADVRGSPAWKALCSGEGEWGEKQALLEITTKGRDGGRVELAWLCLESNKTRRLRGAGSILWELWLIPGNWTETYTQGESIKWLIVRSPFMKISVYSKHISLRSHVFCE
jgi:hypothetical protein